MSENRKLELVRLQEQLSDAESDAQQLADFFDMDRSINRMMDRHKDDHLYATRDAAYDDWFYDHLSAEERTCYGGVDMEKLKRLRTKLRTWLGEYRTDEQRARESRMVEELLEIVALPDEIRLVKLFRLEHCRNRVADLREQLRTAKQGAKRAA